ncbi:MAG: hypothetical protein ACM3KL_03590 [Alphaproteobacteria bacterium]
MKIEAITGGLIGNMSIFPWSREPRKTEVLQISESNWRDNPLLCARVFTEALRGLPAGFYTLVQHDCGYVVDICVGKRGGVRFKPYDGTTINTTHQHHPCLRVAVSP